MLTVVNGTGGGEYAAGTEVNIQADSPPSGQEFDQWTGDTEHVAEVSSASTTVTMPAEDMEVTATYKSTPSPGPSPGPSPVPEPEPEPEPEPVTERIDGMDVTIDVKEDESGHKQISVDIPIVPQNREDGDDPEEAYIPIAFEDDQRKSPVAQIGLPVGVGARATGVLGAQTAGDGLADLIQLIDETADDTEPDKPRMLDGGAAFLEALAEQERLTVSKVTLASNLDVPPDRPVLVRGTPSTAGTPVQATVIDATALPPGSVMELEDVEFAVIIGQDVEVRGGAGSNIVFAGDGSQDILLGAEDDQLHGGAGNDLVGSLGGNDRLFGNAGDDVLYSDQGRNLLHGGLNTDTARFAGARNDYEIEREHAVVTVRSLKDPDQVNTLVNVEQMEFADQIVNIVYEPYLNMIAALYVQALGRQPDLEGFQYWANLYAQGTPAGSIILHLLLSDEAKERGVVLEPGDPSEIINMFYQVILGRDADQAGLAYWLDEHARGMLLSDIASWLFLSEEAGERGIDLDGTEQGDLDVIEMFYRTLLGRPADAQGKAYWNDVLAQGITLREIAALIYASDECRIQGIDVQGNSSADIVEQFYKWLLDRVSDPEGKAWWITYHDAVKDWSIVLEGFVGSEEMQKLYVQPTGWEFLVPNP